MSVGHTARVLDEAGISTVCIYIRASTMNTIDSVAGPHDAGSISHRPDDSLVLAIHETVGLRFAHSQHPADLIVGMPKGT